MGWPFDLVFYDTWTTLILEELFIPWGATEVMGCTKMRNKVHSPVSTDVLRCLSNSLQFKCPAGLNHNILYPVINHMSL